MSFQAWWNEHAFLYSNLEAGLQDVYVTSLAFLDDVYFAASSLADAQAMLNEAFDLFSSIGLKVNIAKLKWMATKHCDLDDNAYLKVGHVHIPRVGKWKFLAA